jgi:dynein heavy chain
MTDILAQLLMQEVLLEGMEWILPHAQFPSPQIGNYADYVKYIEEELPPENPPLFGLHSNAEINFLNAEADMLFRLLMEVSGAVSATAGETREEKAKQVIEDVLKELPERRLDMEDMYARVEERTPYVSVVLQECDRMNILLSEIRSSLQNLEKGLLGELTISESMDRLLNSLFTDLIPETWSAVAYPSTKPLGMWFADLLRRVSQLTDWSADLNLPKTVWISGLFNPMTFLTAIMQTTSRKNDMPIDQMCLQTEVTKKYAEDIGSAPREGAYIHGMFLEGCRWDTASGSLRDSYLKQLHPIVPAMFVRAIHIDKRDSKGMYECPVYKTPMRGPTYVTSIVLRTSDKPHKWILAGVALLLSD